MPTKTTRAKAKPRYEPILKLSPLAYDQFLALRDNIAVNGVLVPIFVDEKKRIIDGNYRKTIADELDYDCPEIVQKGLSGDEKRTMARALNLARRHLSQEQKRQLVADQLREAPDRSNTWVGKQLGVHHATVASVRGELEPVGQIIQPEKRVGSDGKSYKATKTPRIVHRSPAERQARIAATTLICGDCRQEMTKLPSVNIDAIICDPLYPEIRREYGRISEEDWLALMKEIVTQARRVLKPKGSAVFFLQPNSETIGKMRLWLWEFVLWAAKEWNLVQDCYWWAVDAMPLAGTNRRQGLMRSSVKMCVWLGNPDCYRNQEGVLWTPSDKLAYKHRSDSARRTTNSGNTFRNSTLAKAADERGGTTPFNCLPIPIGGSSWGDNPHPAVTPYDVASWWCRYILPPSGVLLDVMAGSGTMLLAGLDHGASRVIGIEQEAKYLKIARKRIEEG